MFRQITAEHVFEAHRIVTSPETMSDPTVPDHAAERVEAALGAAYSATLYRDDHDPTLIYAAALLRNLAQHHAFVDGNKKTAWLICVKAIEDNGYAISMPDIAVVDLCVRVLTEHLDLDVIAEILAAGLSIP